MRLLFRPLFFLSFFVGAFLSAWLAVFSILNLKSNAVSLASFRQALHKSELADFFRSYGPDWYAENARSAAAIAAERTLGTDSVSLYCSSLAGLGRALRFRPWDPALLMGWAGARQLLGAIDCALPLTSGGYEPVLEVGIAHGLSSPGVVFSAALIEHWAGKFKERNMRLREFLESAVRIEAGQMSFITGVLKQAADFKEIVPARFPQIGVISEAIWPQLQSLGPAAAQALEQVQIAALTGGALPAFRHLLSLYPFCAGDAARRALDLNFARSEEMGREAAAYLGLRSQMERIPTVSANIRADRRPARGQLFNWGDHEQFILDQTNASIGFFLPEGASLGLINLEGLGPLTDPLADALELYVSSDNLNWVAVPQLLHRTEFSVAQRTVVGLEIENDLTGYRYFKVRFSKPRPLGSFYNTASSMLSVFGTYAHR